MQHDAGHPDVDENYLHFYLSDGRMYEVIFF